MKAGSRMHDEGPLSCRRATALASKAHDARLSAGERLQLWVHLALCRWCRDYRRQIGLLRVALLRREAAAPHPIPLPGPARTRIRDAMRSARRDGSQPFQ